MVRVTWRDTYLTPNIIKIIILGFLPKVSVSAYVSAFLEYRGIGIGLNFGIGTSLVATSDYIATSIYITFSESLNAATDDWHDRYSDSLSIAVAGEQGNSLAESPSSEFFERGAESP